MRLSHYNLDELHFEITILLKHTTTTPVHLLDQLQIKDLIIHKTRQLSIKDKVTTNHRDLLEYQLYVNDTI